MQAIPHPCHVCLLVSVGVHVNDSAACHRAVSQMSSRTVTFGLNLIIVRLLTPETYGVRYTAYCALQRPDLRCATLCCHGKDHIRPLAPSQLAAVQFHLINTVILFLSREGFRRGCLRTPVVRGMTTRQLRFD